MIQAKHTNRKKLQEIIERIQEIKRITIGRISILCGYKRENYLSERMSSGDISENVIKAVSALYDKAKANSDILDEVSSEKNVVDEPDAEYKQDYKDKYIQLLEKNLEETEKKLKNLEGNSGSAASG